MHKKTNIHKHSCGVEVKRRCGVLVINEDAHAYMLLSSTVSKRVLVPWPRLEIASWSACNGFLFFIIVFIEHSLRSICCKSRSSVSCKAWFSSVGKIPDDRGFYFLPTIPDFADISDIRQRSVPAFPDSNHSLRETEQFRGLVMSEIHRRRTPTSPTVQIWIFICREWSPTIAKSGTRRQTVKSQTVWDFPDMKTSRCM